MAGLCAIASIITFRGTPLAIAQGETRTLTFVHNHTKETATVTFKRWGTYDQSALNQLNWLLRDWRRDEQIKMNPHLFDVLWDAVHEAGSSSAVYVNSAYRSPETNAMLRRRSRAVSKFSQHMHGNAIDFYLSDVPMSRVREVAMRMQRGGVGFYPNANTTFVHLDVGSVRSWPRMTHDQLARLFPDEKTVHLPAGGGAMAGYEEAKAMILARGGSVGGYSGDEETETLGGGASFFASLFGGSGGSGGAVAPTNGDDAGTHSFALNNGRTPETAIASADPSAGRSVRGRLGRQQPVAIQVASAAPSPSPSPIFALFNSTPNETQAAPAPQPGPVAPPAAQPVVVASAAPAKPLDDQALGKTKPPVLAALPMPPSRPPEFSRTALAALAALPLPPLRPTLEKVASAAPVGAPDALGAVIRREQAEAEPPAELAAYASVETPLPPSRPGWRAAALADAAPTTTRPVRNDAAAPTIRTRTLPAPVAAKVAMAPVDAILSEFRRKADFGPSAGAFTGPAVKPIATAGSFR